MRLRFVRPMGSGLSSRAGAAASSALSLSSRGGPSRRRCHRLAAVRCRDFGGASTTASGGGSGPPLRAAPVLGHFWEGGRAAPQRRHMGSSRKGKKKKSDDGEAVVTEGVAAQVKKCNAAMAMLYAPVERKEDPSDEFKAQMDAAFFKYRDEKFQAHKRWAGDLQVKMQLKKEALDALPEEYQNARFQYGPFLAPLSRTPATATPPIEGYWKKDAAAE